MEDTNIQRTGMLNRRSFLGGCVTLPLAASLAACGGPTGNSSQGLRVRLLSKSVPLQVVSQFQRSHHPSFPTDFASLATPAEIFASLQRWQQGQGSQARSTWPWSQPKPIPDVVSLGDAWLGDAIRQGLIQPWPAETWAGWDSLDPIYQGLVRRNDQGLPDPQGQIWALPYRWGSTVMAYRRDKFAALGWEPQDWSDLWRSSLTGNIGLVDDPREVIGLTLKSLGASYNQSLDGVDRGILTEKLTQLQHQVKVYSSTYYIQPLLLGDIWLAVGWSTDLLPLLQFDRELRVVWPTSGTALWADLWVRPTQAQPESLASVQKWVEFCWRSDVAPQFSRFGLGTSTQYPAGLADSQGEILAKASTNPSILRPTPEQLAQSEFLLPLSSEHRQAYQTLWDTMRRSA